jgi:hypothetical protein
VIDEKPERRLWLFAFLFLIAAVVVGCGLPLRFLRSKRCIAERAEGSQRAQRNPGIKRRKDLLRVSCCAADSDSSTYNFLMESAA